MKVHQPKHSEECSREQAQATDANSKEAIHSPSLTSSLGLRARKVAGARMLETGALDKIEKRALDLLTDTPHALSPLLSGRLSSIAGASLREIALVRDVNLRSDGGRPSVEPSRELRRAGQELRRSFNRMSFESKHELSTEALSGLFDRLEQRAQGTTLSKREVIPLTRALTEASRVINLHTRFMPWGDAREVVVRVLGAIREVTATQPSKTEHVSQGPGAPERSLANKYAVAARRSWCATKLGLVQALESACLEFESHPSSKTLENITFVLESWRHGEHGSEGLARGGNTAPLIRELLRGHEQSPQSTLREILRPLVRWSSAHFDNLSDASIGHIKETLAGVVSVMRHATLNEMVRALDGVTFEREPSLSVTTNKPQAQIKKGFDLALNKRLGALSIVGPTIHDVVAHFTLEPSSVTRQQLTYLAQASRWAQEIEKRNMTTRAPFAHTALWISEFDGGQGTTIPREIGQHFTNLQLKLQVSADSTKGGFVHPENVDWLRHHVHQHDGFLLVMQEGPLNGTLSSQTPAALFVATCDQVSPSPLMKKIEEHAASYLADLPQGSSDAHPRMVCELALSSPEASLFARKYGEHAYGALHNQFMFNTISRFPNAERVECFATCREGSTAINAHERMGWKKTGCTYVDEYGTAFDILHNVIFPAATVMGYRDLS